MAPAAVGPGLHKLAEWDPLPLSCVTVSLTCRREACTSVQPWSHLGSLKNAAVHAHPRESKASGLGHGWASGFYKPFG